VGKTPIKPEDKTSLSAAFRTPYTTILRNVDDYTCRWSDTVCIPIVRRWEREKKLIPTGSLFFRNDWTFHTRQEHNTFNPIRVAYDFLPCAKTISDGL